MADLLITSKKKEIKKPNFWTEEEDKILKEKAKEFNYKNWNLISQFIPGRSSVQCSARFRRIRPGLIKGAWGKEEDSKLLSLYTKYGKNWAAISKEMPHRSGKQIRDRFLNYLDTKYERGKFTKEEDNIIIYYNKIYGNSWAKIAKKIKTRTDDMIKNRFYSSLKNTINKNKNLLQIKRKRITPKFKSKSIHNQNTKLKSQNQSIEVDNQSTEKNDFKKYVSTSLNSLNNLIEEDCQIIDQKIKMNNINSTNMIRSDLNNSINNYIDENNISIKIKDEYINNEFTNIINSNQIFSYNENKINQNINRTENYNENDNDKNNNTNFNFEEDLNKNEIINFYDFNNKFFNPKLFLKLNLFDNEESNFYLNQEYDEVNQNLKNINNCPTL